MASERREAQNFREMRGFLPEERKALIEEQIRIIESRRKRILNALRDGRGIPRRVQNSLSHLGIEGERFLKDLQSVIDPESAVRDSQAGDIIDAKLASLQEQLEALGGSTREETLQVLKRYELEKYWFGRAFDFFEGVTFEEILVDRSDTPPEEQLALDIGIGAARASKLALAAVQRKRGATARERFAKNLYGVDLMERFVDMSRNALGPYGVPPDHIVQGDFLDFPPEFLKGQFDCAWAGMHTLFHCTTESDLRRFFGNIERALKPPKAGKRGGRLFFDTVGLYHHQGIPASKRIAKLHDLYDLYGVLIRRYRQDHIDPGRGQGTPLLSLRRFPIYDNTTGAGFYAREVLTKEYIDYVLRGMKSKLRRVRGPIQLTNNTFPSDRAKELGFQWIKENGLGDWLKREIAYRVSQIRLDPNGYAFLSKLLNSADDTDPPGAKVPFSRDIKPLYALPKAERDALLLETNTWEVEAGLEKVALRMVHDYVQFYYLYELTS